MAKNKYLEKIVPFLEGKYGKDKANHIMTYAWKRYEELLEENKDEPKSYYIHTRQWFYCSNLFSEYDKVIRIEILSSV